jgi:hypothetical protein
MRKRLKGGKRERLSEAICEECHGHLRVRELLYIVWVVQPDGKGGYECRAHPDYLQSPEYLEHGARLNALEQIEEHLRAKK